MNNPKKKLALLGCGFLNEIVAEACLNEILGDFELVACLGHNNAASHAFAAKYHCQECTTIDELIAAKPDFIAEAASVKSIQEYALPILKNKINLVVLSIGAFADAEFYQAAAQTAAESNSRVYIASGAVGGFDVLQTASLMSPVTASFHSKKAPLSLKGTPLFTDDLPSITSVRPVFDGTAGEAIKQLPTKVNVAVAAALASVGANQLAMQIDAVPDFSGDEYVIKINGEEVNADFRIYSATSRIAAWSVIRVLNNAISPIVF